MYIFLLFLNFTKSCKMGVDRDGLLYVCEWLGTGYT
jgi:hypothetical protein